VKKTLSALAQTGLKRMVVAGGVGANALLRSQLNAACQQRGVRVHYPELEFCTDNGAMIALAAGLRVQAGLAFAGAEYPAAPAVYRFDVRPRWPLAELSSAPH
jgi:N6-L-threonylcarbamoyladenine synthase